MATTGIWKIEKRLDHVIDYTTNVEKTINSEYGKDNYKDLHNVIEYATADYKTEKQYYVSGINCSPETALKEMTITKKEYEKTSGILGFHAFQSFAEGEVTPELAHTIGIKLAEQMWGDRFEVIVSTHLNTKHYHNHFVINSVSFKDGKRYYDKRETYAELRHLSDTLCEEYGISVLKEKACRNSKINYSNYYKGTTEKSNYHTITKEDIDKAIAQAYSFSDFEMIMTAMNYKLYFRGKDFSVSRYPYSKHIRVGRSYGEEYSIDRIKERINEEQSTKEPFPESSFSSIYKNLNNKTINKVKHSGIYGLYLHYCYLLKVFPKENPRKKLSPSIRADIYKMDNISKEAELLVSNQINTYEQFFLYKNSKIKELDDLRTERSKLWYKHKKSSNSIEKESIRKDLDSLNEKIKPLKEVVQLCDDIETRLPMIEKNLEEVKDEKERRKD